MGIKIVAIDIYGTVLASDDFDYSCPPRKGLECFLDQCQAREVKVVTSSDAFNGNVRNDLAMAFRPVPRKKLSIERFDGFFQIIEPMRAENGTLEK